MKPEILEYLKKKYEDNGAVDSAVSNDSNNKRAALWGSIAEGFLRPGDEVKTDFYDKIAAQGEGDVKQARLDKKAALGDYLRSKRSSEAADTKSYQRDRDLISDKRADENQAWRQDQAEENKNRWQASFNQGEERNKQITQDRNDQRNYAREEKSRANKLKSDALQRKLNPTHDEKVKGLGGEERKRLDSALMGADAADLMQKALDAGDNTFSVIGDNDYTMARSRFTEALGRMQSGGAINSDELAKFESMAPSFTDSKDIQDKKMKWLKNEMEKRINNVGFTREEFNKGNQQASKTITNKKYSPSRNQSKITYSDGTTEVVDGQ